jgi:hypothetical protein
VSPLFLLGCAFLVAAVMIGLGLANVVGYVIAGVLAVGGFALVVRGATRPPKRAIRSHSGAAERAKARARGKQPARAPHTKGQGKAQGKGGSRSAAKGKGGRGGKGRAKR